MWKERKGARIFVENVKAAYIEQENGNKMTLRERLRQIIAIRWDLAYPIHGWKVLGLL